MQSARDKIRSMREWSEKKALKDLLAADALDSDLRQDISNRAENLVSQIRAETSPGMMELFLSEYGLSSEEGVALMCLAEALLRVPDGTTMDALIEDKITSSEWDKHLGQSHSSLINASTWALFVTGKVLDSSADSSIAAILHGAVKRVGEPVIRQAVIRVMKELGRQFVLGETIQSAMEVARASEEKGYSYSYDMLGEAALTEQDARRFYLAYSDAIGQIAKASASDDIRENPGISIKLSALHPRYEILQRDRVMEELMPRARSLAILAKSAGIGLNIDAEEAGRLDLSLDVIEAIVQEPALRDWEGFGVVVQAYGICAPAVIDWLYALSEAHDRKLMVRLVKGAYWDTEIKHAQVEGHSNFPVFTQKASTDVSYICCAKKLLEKSDRLYPQFATHNAHTVAAILEMAKPAHRYEFQRLHGMGEALHETVLKNAGTRCRIYAPVGSHKDLLAYLVRRLLENGANSSFVNQIVDETVSPKEVAADPFSQVYSYLDKPEHPNIKHPSALFSPDRENSKGWNIEEPLTLSLLNKDLSEFSSKAWETDPAGNNSIAVKSPANGKTVGTAHFHSAEQVAEAIDQLQPWTEVSAIERSDVLRNVARAYEDNSAEIFALLMREAGKTLNDCIGELREAVDFLRYYANEAESIEQEPCGLFACISPWNFPLAIFTGQIAAALSVGNGVIAKPAESTPLVASFAISLMHKSGVSTNSLKLVHGKGSDIGDAITTNPALSGVCFTGSTATAQIINRNMAHYLQSHAPLIAETGGLNAMIVDSTALPEQAITDILASAFQSAGQRCSALRMLYLQEDIAAPFLTMLFGAMDELKVGDPWDFSTDIGPLIDANALKKIENHIASARKESRLLKQIDKPEKGHFVAPAVIKVTGISQLEEEIFGPVLHVATYRAGDFDQVIEEINQTGYGLTFGMHSRIDERVQAAIDQVNVGNIYINRNQIGAVVGSQPFGGHGLSGTGPKAGGPKYLKRFLKVEPELVTSTGGNAVSSSTINEEFEALEKNKVGQEKSTNMPEPINLPGPTGESNLYGSKPIGRVLCLGPGAESAAKQAETAANLGCIALAVAPGVIDGIDGIIDPGTLRDIRDLSAIISFSDQNTLIRQALSERERAIVPLLTDLSYPTWLETERHICIDTTAAGGNAALLGDSDS